MELLRISDRIKFETCACIGSFDGFHLGHRAIVEETKNCALWRGMKILLITFRKHPRLDENLLFSEDEKMEFLESLGVDFVLLLEREDMEIKAEEFLRILIENFGVKRLVMGFNHRFGKDREGDPSFIISRIEDFPIEVLVFPPIKINGITVSSSNIRKLLLDGKVEEVVPLLGRRYSLKGRKVIGRGFGRILGFPTVNLEVDREKLIPKDGVYAVYLPELDKFGVMHIGERPTFSLEKSLEVHILDFDGDVGETLKVEFIRRIRDVKKFESEDELREAIAKDIREASRLRMLELHKG
jgi:riboflavin kinase/FMN adenylyltransferase